MKKSKLHYAWLILIACCAIQAGSQGTVFDTTGVFISPVCTELGFEVGKFSLAQTFSAIAMMVAQPFTTKVYRKFDMKKVLLISGVIYYLSHFSLSFANEIWHWYLLLAIQGIAGGFFYRTSYTIILCNWFVSKTAYALGIATAVGSIAGMLMNPATSFIIEGFGWRVGYRTLAIIGAIITLPIIAAVVKAKPSELNMKPYVDNNVENKEEYFPNKYNERQTRLICLLLILSSAFAYFCGGYYAHLPNYCVSIGMGIAAGSLMTSFELGGTMVMKFLLGPILDRIGIMKTELLIFILSIAGYLGYFVLSGGVLYFTTALCGIYCATNMVLLSLFAREQVGEEKFQEVLPWMTTIGAAISAISNTIYGFLFDSFGNYYPMFGVCIIGIIISYLIILLIKRQEKKRSC